MSWSFVYCRIHKDRLSGDAISYFSFQLAICIERKCQMNEDYQDCIGSVDDIDSMTEVTDHFFLLILVIRLIGVLLFVAVTISILCFVLLL